MRLKRIAFSRDVPNPGTESMERGNWLHIFSEPSYSIERNGDDVVITHAESLRARVYPWSAVAGSEVYGYLDSDAEGRKAAKAQPAKGKR